MRSLPSSFLATTVSKLPFAVAIPAGWNIRQRVRPTIEHRQPICAQALAYKVGTVIGCSISEDGVALRISAAFATAGRMIQRISDCSVGIVLDRNVGVGCSFNICLFLFAQFIVPYRPPVTVPKMRVSILSRPFLFFGIEKAELLFEAPLELVYTLFCFIGMIPSTWITKNISILSKRLMLV